MEYSIKQLSSEDWEIAKAIRLEALLLEANSFTSNYQRESQYTSGDWQNFIGSGNNKAMFALTHNNEVIGFSGIVRGREDENTAMLVASYIRAAHRGKDLSRLFYSARIAWAKANGFKNVIVSHRESNIASKKANQKFGFQFTHTEDHIWNDGKTEKIYHYKLQL